MVFIFCKVHGTGSNTVLAVCDKEILGKTLKEGKISFSASQSFYKGAEVGEEELRKKIREFGNVNIVGNKAVSIALEEKLVSQESIVEIAGVKHVQIFKI